MGKKGYERVAFMMEDADMMMPMMAMAEAAPRPMMREAAIKRVPEPAVVANAVPMGMIAAAPPPDIVIAGADEAPAMARIAGDQPMGGARAKMAPPRRP